MAVCYQIIMGLPFDSVSLRSGQAFRGNDEGGSWTVKMSWLIREEDGGQGQVGDLLVEGLVVVAALG